MFPGSLEPRSRIRKTDVATKSAPWSGGPHLESLSPYAALAARRVSARFTIATPAKITTIAANSLTPNASW